MCGVNDKYINDAIMLNQIIGRQYSGRKSNATSNGTFVKFSASVNVFCAFIKLYNSTQNVPPSNSMVSWGFPGSAW